MKTEKFLLPAVLLFLILIILSLFASNKILRKQNMFLTDNFNLLMGKIEALESEMVSKKIPPISPEKAIIQRGTEKAKTISTDQSKTGNKGYLTKDGQLNF